LFAGVLAGSLIISSGNPFAGFLISLEKISQSMADDWNAKLLLFNLFVGAGVALIWRLGGSKALTTWARRYVRTQRTANFGGWLLGLLVFFNDYVNAPIVGNVFRDLFDELRISREKLSYILDSTAAPVATFVISDWTAFQIGVIQSGVDAAGIKDTSAFAGNLQSIPLNLYPLFVLIFGGLLALTGKDFGPMLKAENRTRSFGTTFQKGAAPLMDVSNELGEAKNTRPMLISFLLPIVGLVGVTLYGFWWTGQGNGNASLMQILANADSALALMLGSFCMMLVGITVSVVYRIMTINETIKTVVDGMKLMLMACSVLVLAWSLSAVTSEMKLADFVIIAAGDSIPFSFIPLGLFLLSMMISFATGTSWGTMTILTPIAIPLAYEMSGDSTTAITMAGIVFSGAIFGDHCSPISDTTVLASVFAGADHIDHFTTQLPYGLFCAGLAALMYLALGLFSVKPYTLVITGTLLLVLFFLLVPRPRCETRE
jgi:Na+/H+ antiporter NhaC